MRLLTPPAFRLAARFAVVLALAAGCTVEERMVWSPDGSRAAVELPSGLCLADTNGVLSPPIASDVTHAAWLPDGRGLVLLREWAVTNWAEVRRLVPPDETVPVEALAGALPALLKSALAAVSNDFDALSTKVFAPLGMGALPWEAAVLCLRGEHPQAWTEMLNSIEPAAARAEATEKLRDAGQAVVREISVARLDGVRSSAGPPLVVMRSLQRLADPRPSPAGALLAFLCDDALTVAPLDGGTGRVTIAEQVTGSYDWTPDGRALVFAVRLAKEWETSGINLAHVQRRSAVDSNGIPAAGASEPLALSAFAFPPRIRCLPDGRVLFAGVPMTLPSAEVAGAARFYIAPGGGTNAGPVAVAAGAAALPADLGAFAVSPDGTRVAVAESGSDSIAVLDLATGALEVVSPGRGAKSRTLPAWRGNRELYFVALPAPGSRRPGWMRWSAGGAAPEVFSAGWPAVAVDGLMELPSPEAPTRATGLPTTTPVTQDRDRATYNWQTRHEEILARHREVKPDVVIIGDSIIHYWGGEPKAPLAWAPQAWSNCFAGLKVTNLGYGWDRTENVLWRIDHGELDGIAPKVIVIKIGTNNTGTHTPEEIAAGIEAVCAAAHAKQPDAKILLLGILARKDENAPRPAITDKINRLLVDRLSGIPWLTVRDVGDLFRNADGTPNVKLFSDGVHVNAAGYEILGGALRASVTGLLRR